MAIYQLPIPREDESLYSLVARIRRKNSFRSDLDACNALLGPSAVRRVDACPIDFSHFCSSILFAYGGEERVLLEYTIANYFEHIGRRPWHAGVRQLTPLQAGTNLVLLSHGIPREWRACRACIAADLGKWGSSYWRRSHQLPGTLICPTHGSPLMSLPASQVNLSLQFVMPEDVVFTEDLPAYTDNQVALLEIIGRINDSISNDAICGSEVRREHMVLLFALQDRGLIDAKGKIRKKELIGGIGEHFQPLRQLPQFNLALHNKTLESMIHALVRGKAIGPIHFVLLTAYLFDRWEALKERRHWERAIDMSLPSACREENGECLFDLTQYHRRVCLNALNTYPGLTRSEFARAAPKSFRWLLQRDNSWFESCLPKYEATCQKRLPFC